MGSSGGIRERLSTTPRPARTNLHKSKQLQRARVQRNRVVVGPAVLQRGDHVGPDIVVRLSVRVREGQTAQCGGTGLGLVPCCVGTPAIRFPTSHAPEPASTMRYQVIAWGRVQRHRLSRVRRYVLRRAQLHDKVLPDAARGGIHVPNGASGDEAI